MGRSYAGCLGLIAFLAQILRGVIGGAGMETILFQAWLSLFAFAAIGYVLGSVASFIVEDSVQTKIGEELAAQEASTGTKPVRAGA